MNKIFITLFIIICLTACEKQGYRSKSYEKLEDYELAPNQDSQSQDSQSQDLDSLHSCPECGCCICSKPECDCHGLESHNEEKQAKTLESALKAKLSQQIYYV